MSRPIDSIGGPAPLVLTASPPATEKRPTIAEAFGQPNLQLDIVTTPRRWPNWLPPEVTRDLEGPFSPGMSLRVLPSAERRINVWTSTNDDGTEIEFLRYLPEDPEHYAKRFPGDPDRARRLRAAAITWNRDVRISVEEQNVRPSEAIRLTKQIHDNVFRLMVAAAGVAFGAGISVHRAQLQAAARSGVKVRRAATAVPSATEARTLLGTSPRVGDFRGIRGKSVAEVLRRIPTDATRRELRPDPGKVLMGFEYSWKRGDKTYKVRIHGADASRPATDNSGAGWIVRVQRGKRYFDNEGTLHPSGVHKPASSNYNPDAANATHIPLAGNRHAN